MAVTTKFSSLGVYLRGLAMGAADVVPGVSGGTVAFITGIYEELLASIKSINPNALVILFRQGPVVFWQLINGNFLLLLMLGILTSILSLARLISELLEHHPLLLWSFFFGLIAASSVHMLRQIKRWQPLTVIVLVLGVAVALLIAELKPAQLSPDLPVFFAAGCVAICAMILPGISGSFILLLMGMYGHVLAAIKDFQWLELITFASGCGLGLLSFSQLLSWLFTRFHDFTMALLTGFLMGSLSLVWPWKNTLSHYQNSKGESLPLQQSNVLPQDYIGLDGSENTLLPCLLLVILGLLVVFILEKSVQNPKAQEE